MFTISANLTGFGSMAQNVYLCGKHVEISEWCQLGPFSAQFHALGGDLAVSVLTYACDGTEDRHMRFTFITRIADALIAHPQRIGGLAFGIIIPLLVAGLALAPRIGGLSDTSVSDAPQSYSIPVE
jgi:hypothetical protein